METPTETTLHQSLALGSSMLKALKKDSKNTKPLKGLPK